MACRDDAARCGYDELKTKPDDSLDLYFGAQSVSASTAPLPLFDTARGHSPTSSRSDTHRRGVSEVRVLLQRRYEPHHIVDVPLALRALPPLVKIQFAAH